MIRERLVVEPQHDLRGRRPAFGDGLNDVIVRHDDVRAEQESGAERRASVDRHLDAAHARLDLAEPRPELDDVEKRVRRLDQPFELRRRRRDAGVLRRRDEARIAGDGLTRGREEIRRPALRFGRPDHLEDDLFVVVAQGDVFAVSIEPRP
jgi:hypothetical protein